jgi:hypothetical protein
MFQSEHTTHNSTSLGAVGLSDVITIARQMHEQLPVATFGSLDVAAAMKDLRVLRGVVDAVDAALRTRARELQPPPPPPPGPGAGPRPKPEPLPEAGPPGLGIDVSPGSLDALSGLTSAQGRRRDRHARVLEHLRSFRTALASGQISESHVAVLSELLCTAKEEVWAALPQHETELLQLALTAGPMPFKRSVNRLIARIAAELGVGTDRDLTSENSASFWIDRDTGLGRLIATFDPASYAKIAAVLASAANRKSWSNRWLSKKEANALALIDLITAPVGSEDGSSVASTVTVLIDHDTLVHGPHSGSICEQADGSRVPVDVAREIACNSLITPVLRDRYGVVLDVGRARRWVTPMQRRAMEAMYATCFITDCETPITECHEHHIVYWEHGGTTDMSNLVPVCQHHHRWIHASNPRITIDDDREITITMRNGTVTKHRPDRLPGRAVGDGSPAG